MHNDQFRDTASAGPAMYSDFLEADNGDADRRHSLGTVAG